jgi:hypothetical protein
LVLFVLQLPKVAAMCANEPGSGASGKAGKSKNILDHIGDAVDGIVRMERMASGLEPRPASPQRARTSPQPESRPSIDMGDNLPAIKPVGPKGSTVAAPPAARYDAADAAIKLDFGDGADPEGPLPPPPLTCRRLLGEIGLLTVVGPAIVMAICGVIGPLLALVEGWDALTGALYTLSVVCGLTTPLGAANDVDPDSVGGKVFAGLAGVWALSIVGAIAGSVGELVLVRRYIWRCACLTGWLRRRCCCGACAAAGLVFLLNALVVGPALLGVFLLAFDLIWLAAEGWSHTDGLFYQLSSVGGLPNPLNDVEPTHLAIDVAFTLWTFFATSVIVGLSGVLVEPVWTSIKQARCCGSCCSNSCCRKKIDPVE